MQPVALVRMLAPWAGFHGDTLRGISCCHSLSCDASAAMTDLDKNYIQMRMEDGEQKTKKRRSLRQIDEVLGWVMVSLHKMVSLQNGDTQGQPPPT